MFNLTMNEMLTNVVHFVWIENFLNITLKAQLSCLFRKGSMLTCISNDMQVTRTFFKKRKEKRKEKTSSMNVTHVCCFVQ